MSSRRTLTFYRDKTGEWRWNLHAGNGRIIADSGESYHNRADAAHGAALVLTDAAYNMRVVGEEL